MSDQNFRQELVQRAKQLLLDKGTDAAVLALRNADSPLSPAQLRKLDLGSLSAIHTTANGSVELKFIDKIKLFELLLSAESEDKPASDGFIEAIDRAAMRLGKGAEDTGDGENEDEEI